jgi:serine protease Do
MKQLMIALLFGSLSPCLYAQDAKGKKEETVTNISGDADAKKPGKKETREITIRKKGDKEINMRVEINGDKITVNGKPLSEFKDKDITINNRKMIITDGDGIALFDGDDIESFTYGEGHLFDGGTAWTGKSKAFLGVVTEKEGNGVRINDITKNSAAEKAGLKEGDIITQIGDNKITDPEVLSEIIATKKPDEEVKISYKRDGKENKTTAKLGKRNNRIVARAPQAQNYRYPEAQAWNFDGEMRDLEALSNLRVIGGEQRDNMFFMLNDRKKLGLKIQDTDEGDGVQVINVEDSSAAALAGLKKDDLIVEIDGKKVSNTDEAREQLKPEEGKKAYQIKAMRNGTAMSFNVRIPRKLKTANL